MSQSCLPRSSAAPRCSISGAFDEIVEFTPPGGPTEIFRLNESKGHLRGDEVTCLVDDTKTFPDGVVHVVGTVTGFFTPRKS
jgi:hypothetical protein